MAQPKLGPKLFILLFCIAIFLLTSMGLAVYQYGMLVEPSFLFTLAYMIAWALLLALTVDLFGGKGGSKLSGMRILILTLGVMLLSTLFTHVVWTITAPKWSFSVSADGATYRPGETVTIKASLSNMGMTPHSFISASNNPVVIRVEYQYTANPTQRFEVYYSSLSIDITRFTVEAGETLERNFLWNQTDIYRPEQEIGQGTYWIQAFIPRDNAETFGHIGLDALFSAWTSINITLT